MSSAAQDAEMGVALLLTTHSKYTQVLPIIGGYPPTYSAFIQQSMSDARGPHTHVCVCLAVSPFGICTMETDYNGYSDTPSRSSLILL